MDRYGGYMVLVATIAALAWAGVVQRTEHFGSHSYDAQRSSPLRFWPSYDQIVFGLIGTERPQCNNKCHEASKPCWRVSLEGSAVADVERTHIVDDGTLEYHRRLLRAAAVRAEAARARLAGIESSTERSNAECEIGAANKEIEHHRGRLDHLNPRRPYSS